MKVELSSIIPSEKIRAAIYAIYILLVLATGAFNAGFQAAGLEDPTWLVVTGSVLGYLGVAVGGLALANTPKKVEVEDKPLSAEVIAQRIEND